LLTSSWISSSPNLLKTPTIFFIRWNRRTVIQIILLLLLLYRLIPILKDISLSILITSKWNLSTLLTLEIGILEGWRRLIVTIIHIVIIIIVIEIVILHWILYWRRLLDKTLVSHYLFLARIVKISWLLIILISPNKLKRFWIGLFNINVLFYFFSIHHFLFIRQSWR